MVKDAPNSPSLQRGIGVGILKPRSYSRSVSEDRPSSPNKGGYAQFARDASNGKYEFTHILHD